MYQGNAALSLELWWEKPAANDEVVSGTQVHTDHLGTPQVLTNESGTIVWKATYTPFGKATVDPSSTVEFNIRGIGQYFDQETGLHYNGFRMLDPDHGRYLSSDPIGLAAGLNTYAHVGNNPLKYIDPLGLFSTFDFVDHYYFGGGTPIDLGDVGLLGNFRNSSSVSGAIQSFKALIAVEAAIKARKACNKCDSDTKKSKFTVSDKVVTDVTSEPGLYAVGNSTFYMKANCDLTVDCSAKSYKYTCDKSFSIRDWFRDPIDLGIEIGGTPYKIFAFWKETCSGSGTF